jgi:hypothetical protein
VPRFTQMTGLRALTLAAGMPIKAMSEMLGHSTSAFTADVYTEVAEELAKRQPRPSPLMCPAAARSLPVPFSVPSRDRMISLRYSHGV